MKKSDIEKARTRAAEFLGFKAEVSIQEGIGRTIEHFRAAAGTETA